ncbi:hypothetical protein NQ317_014199 [Molorchus minor]|uniref:Tyr recombinase domain-containing protein n=1 Tax=Molorchus minor TaxID=1323400 RepID=A0ABQ9JB83_9CUCU|nr:hypothetical protein NQ317_014199 [Molorchus minor]
MKHLWIETIHVEYESNYNWNSRCPLDRRASNNPLKKCVDTIKGNNCPVIGTESAPKYSNLSPEIIKWPNDVEKRVSEEHFWENGFPNVLGAIDGSHIKIDKPDTDPDSYINRKGYYSIQMQAVCDHTQKILDVFIGYPGSVHDSRVFRNSPLKNNLEEKCGQYFLLADNQEHGAGGEEFDDIGAQVGLIIRLINKAVGYQAKKSKVLTREQIDKFLKEANDDKYLLLKVILIMVISGALRRDELVKMAIEDIQEENAVIIVTVPDTKTDKKRIFTVTNIHFIRIYRKYAALRPKPKHIVNNRRIFLRYVNGKCTSQVVGVHTIGKVPSMIARYLRLPNPETYTGHCFRRSSATLLANTGADMSISKVRWMEVYDSS